MRIVQAAGSRQEYYDRNVAVNPTSAYSAAAVGPHATTQRINYTTPTATKTFLSIVSMVQLRTTVATTVGKTRIYMQIAGVIVFLAQTFNIAVATTDKSQQTLNHLMVAGNSVQIVTDDASVGGAVDYDGAILGFEFNA